jgi:hypothetical protein
MIFPVCRLSRAQVQKPTGNKFVRDPWYGPKKKLCSTELSVRARKAISPNNGARTNTCLDIQSFIQQQKDKLNAPTGQGHVFQKSLRDRYTFGTDIVPVDGLNFSSAICWPTQSELSVIARQDFCTRSSEILVALMLPTIHPAFNRFLRVAHGRGDVPGIAEKHGECIYQNCISGNKICRW